MARKPQSKNKQQQQSKRKSSKRDAPALGIQLRKRGSNGGPPPGETTLHKSIDQGLNVDSNSACGLPYPPFQDSQKVVCEGIFNTTADNNGTAFVAFVPSGLNDKNMFVSTNGTTTTWSGAGVFPAFNSADAGLTGTKPQTPYSSANVGYTGVQWRPVSAVMDFTYSGAPLYRQGAYKALTEPTGQALNGLTDSDLSRHPKVVIQDYINNAHKFSLHGNYNSQADSDYTTATSGSVWCNTNATDYSTCAYFYGLPPNGTTTPPGQIEVRYRVVFEYIGEGVGSASTPNGILPIGAGEHHALALQKAHEVRKTTRKHGRTLSKIMSNVIHAARGTIKHGPKISKVIDSTVGLMELAGLAL